MRLRSAAIALLLCAAPAAAEIVQGTDDTGQTGDLPWLEWDYATGDWWRNRSVFSDSGFDFTATYTAQVWGNVVGGIEQNAAYFGLLQFGLDADLEKAIGWKGGSFNTTWVWLSGDQPTAQFVGANFAVSGIEAPADFRCLDLWIQQKLFSEKLTLRAGMFNADRDFTVSEYANFFLNSGFGWPILYNGELGGPPAYPFAAPGVYAALEPTEGWILQAAVMQGDAYTDSANFHWNIDRMNGLLFLNEAIYTWSKAPLPGTAKLGALFTTGYPDIPGETDTEAWGGSFFYGIVDQALYNEAGSTPDNPQGLGWFARGGFAAPQRSSSLGMLVETGLVYAGPFPGRDDDSAGLGFIWNQSSPQQASALEGSNRGLEMIFEASYQWQLAPWCSVQPDLQYILQPNGSTAIPNALVLGISVAIEF
jgi:porin